jgi:hypothetical protein
MRVTTVARNEVVVFIAEAADGSAGDECESYDEARTVASDEGGRVLARVYVYDRTEVLDDFAR